MYGDCIKITLVFLEERDRLTRRKSEEQRHEGKRMQSKYEKKG